ncbi:flagellar basal body-associated FliL family protein [Marinomonas sp. C2222]|uniref:Flagellar protein FliL n=1 Tax=Marinomonas sargassi TaxID=2984494 RepID=A0ABT2YNC2_9GAMM|nr:flagellar basal body-associated FliL family protein [Marinomonas sargassi]MCV2401388.1 flagellar basal body-associated FliL family protein [Marinomonas sargassi]
MADDDLDIGGEEESSGGKKKLIIIIALVVVLLGGGAAAFFLFFSGSDEPVEEEGGEAPMEEMVDIQMPSMFLALDPAFIVDYMVDGKQRYVQLSLTVQSKDAGQINALTLHMPLIRNSLLLLFASQSFTDLQTQAGKTALKEASVDAINGILQQETGMGGIDNVLFTNFVMQ